MGNCLQNHLAINPDENSIVDKQQGSNESNEVYYYVQGFGARGTIVRLAFEIAGVEYIDASDEDSAKNVGADIKTGYPTFAYPVVKIDGAIISQTPAICQYVMAKGGFQPKCVIKQTQSLQGTQIIRYLFTYQLIFTYPYIHRNWYILRYIFHIHKNNHNLIYSCIDRSRCI